MTIFQTIENRRSGNTRRQLFTGSVVFLMLLFGMFSTSPVKAQSAAESAAMKQVSELLATAHQAAGNFRNLRSIISRHFAIGTWTNASLGRAANQITSGQRSRVRQLMPGYIAKQYFTQFGGSGSKPGSVQSARSVRGDVLVTSKIPSRSRTFTVTWRMRVIGGRPRVIDYVTGGISGVVLRRSEFGQKIQQSGGDGLISFMEQFIGS